LIAGVEMMDIFFDAVPLWIDLTEFGFHHFEFAVMIGLLRVFECL
jgi:hypothetical protein